MSGAPSRFARIAALLTLCLTTLFAPRASATADTLCVNHVTRQLAVFEDDDFTGIFWACVGGESRTWHMAEEVYISRGYTFTRTPLLLDTLVIVLAVGTLVSGIAMGRRMRMRRPTRRGESRRELGR